MKAKILLFFSTILMATLLLPSAYAQPKAGNNEVSGGASFFHPIGSGAGNFNLDVAYGKYLNDPH